MIEGAEELERKLNSISDAMRKEIIEKAVWKGIQTVRAEAVLLCPVDTGELRSSIKTNIEVSSDTVFGIVYTNKEYAPYVEFGTGPAGKENHSGISPEVTVEYRQTGWSYKDEDGNWVYTNGQPAQPFLYPALKNNETHVKKQIIDEISDELERMV
ncbi:MAG: HK97 gp10 family phage protein [Lachnospiraceae bacterium]|nr:HK97 gp10 family phage protein [Lachnospiraceae bacterium]